MRAILSGKKSFLDPLIGHPRLNRLGLHPLRCLGSDAALFIRRAQLRKPPDNLVQRFDQDGILVMENLLSDGEFSALRDEVNEAFDRAERAYPYPSPVRKGFGPRQPFTLGHDHYDGSTLIRNIYIDEGLPRSRAFARREDLRILLSYLAGFDFSPKRARLCQTLVGAVDAGSDIQAEPHKDSFHSTIKLWYFVEDCALEQGPLAFSPGSHRMTRRRLLWEYRRAMRASACGDASGSFRVTSRELDVMRVQRPRPLPVPANTLVVADTRGFHHRAVGRPGTRRRAIHAVLKRDPFSLNPR